MKILTGAKQLLLISLTAQFMLSTQMSTMAQAEMVSTDAAISKYAAYANRDFLLSELQKQEIRDEIVALGVDPAEAEKRLAALSDAEIQSIVSQIDQNSAGGDAGTTIISALLTVFIILLVTDILCFTQVFSFARCIR